MRALNQVRVPRAMWRVGTCLGMRVVPIPHVCRRSLRVVTRAMVHRARLDMVHRIPATPVHLASGYVGQGYATHVAHHGPPPPPPYGAPYSGGAPYSTAPPYGPQPPSAHRHRTAAVRRTVHRRSFQGLAHRSTTRMGVRRTVPHQPNSRTAPRPPHLRLTTSPPSPQHRHRPESRDQYRTQARLHPLPMPFGRALALPTVVLALKGVRRYGL